MTVACHGQQQPVPRDGVYFIGCQGGGRWALAAWRLWVVAFPTPQAAQPRDGGKWRPLEWWDRLG